MTPAVMLALLGQIADDYRKAINAGRVAPDQQRRLICIGKAAALQETGDNLADALRAPRPPWDDRGWREYGMPHYQPTLPDHLPNGRALIPAGLVADLAAERARQLDKWGEQNHPDGTGPRVALAGLLCYAAQAAEDARRACQTAARRGKVTWRHILTEETAEAYAEDDPGELRRELVQVAAVAVAWIEAIDRRPVG